MKRIIIMYMAVALLTGCGGRENGWQTSDVTLVQVVGVDLSESGVRISAVTEGENDSRAGDLLLVEDTSVAGGVRALRGAGDGLVHLGHVEHVVLGESLAQHGVEPVLDFVARDRQIGPGVQLWVLKENPAERGLASGGANVAERLERLAGNRKDTKRQIPCTATRMMGAVAGEESVAVPALRAGEDGLVSDGYGILHCGRLVGFLDADESLGLELLSGNGDGQQVAVVLPDGAQVVFAVTQVRMVAAPVFDEDGLTELNVRCRVQLDVEQGARLNEVLRRQAEEYAQTVLHDRISAAVARARFWGTDYVGAKQWMRETCSEREWRTEDWIAEFRAASVAVEVCPQVRWPADMVEEGKHG